MLKRLFFTLLVTLPVMAFAEDEAAPAGPQVQYIYFEPAFVVNYGSTGRIKYMRTDVALNVSTTEAGAAVDHHKPYMRNSLVMLFSAQ